MGELKRSTKTITLMCDNQSSIKLAHNLVHHQRTKHVKVAWHFIRQAMKEGDVNIEFVRNVFSGRRDLHKGFGWTKAQSKQREVGTSVTK